MKPLNSYTNTQLCDIIIAHRYLKIFKDEYMKCMEELALRRENGDNFDYETYIESNLQTLPSLNINVKDISKSLEQLKNMAYKK